MKRSQKKHLKEAADAFIDAIAGAFELGIQVNEFGFGEEQLRDLIKLATATTPSGRPGDFVCFCETCCFVRERVAPQTKKGTKKRR